MLGALARREGGEVGPSEAAPLRERSIEEQATENAVEGCVFETFGALLAQWQATHAVDLGVRASLARLARDETRHAALAWTMAAWLEARLTPEARLRVREARARARRELLARLSIAPARALRERGFKGQFYQTHGAALPEFLKLGGKKVEGTVLAASLMLVLDQVTDAHPSRKIAIDYVNAYEKLHGVKPATFGGNVFDAGLLLKAAIPVAATKGKPGTPAFRSALRDALEQTKDMPATQGVYNMSPADHSGFDERGRELITVSGGKWTLIP